ncbi:MAG: hydrogenase 3 maturation endopeptidase HyCI [Candidatus Omnitrophota bacterium]
MPKRNYAYDEIGRFYKYYMTMEFPAVFSKLKLEGRVVIAGIGNILKADDAFGPKLIEMLDSKINAVCIDAATAPENYIGKIAGYRPDTILIADAVFLGKESGACEILEKGDILKCGFTTHDISPAMFMEFLENRTHAKIYMLGVQPENLSLGGEMSSVVKEALKKTAAFLLSTLGEDQHA